MEVLEMAMRSQVYEWDAGRDTAVSATAEGSALSIFIGGRGNNITKPAETTATQFVVIEDIGVTPTAYHGATGSSGTYRGLRHDTATECSGPRAYVQVVINTTSYFLDPYNYLKDV